MTPSKVQRLPATILRLVGPTRLLLGAIRGSRPWVVGGYSQMAYPNTTGITSATWETTQPRPAGRMLHGNSDAGWKLGGLAPWSTYFTNQVALTSLWTNPFGPQFHKVQMKIFEPDGLQGCVKPGHCKPGAARSCRGMWRHLWGISQWEGATKRCLYALHICLAPARSPLQDSKPRMNLSLRKRRAGREITLPSLKMMS